MIARLNYPLLGTYLLEQKADGYEFEYNSNIIAGAKN